MNDKLKDVVCGMEVASTCHAVDYQGSRFAFCSAQCRERFIAHPHLYIGLPGQPAPKQQGRMVRKRRSFELDTALDSRQAEAVREHVRALMGVEAIAAEGARVSVTYDLLQVTAVQIEAAFEAAGAQLGSGWGARLRRGFAHYTEECEVGHLQVAPPSGCH
jgi:YHS domain-containing protein